LVWEAARAAKDEYWAERITRLGADVDLTTRLTPDEPGAFVSAMQTHGFEARVTDPQFVDRTRVIPPVHTASGLPLDVVLAGRGLEDEFLRPDATALWRLHGSRLDAGRIRAILMELQEALEQSHLVPAFDSLAQR
jgi:hypothetical protein